MAINGNSCKLIRWKAVNQSAKLRWRWDGSLFRKALSYTLWYTSEISNVMTCDPECFSYFTNYLVQHRRYWNMAIIRWKRCGTFFHREEGSCIRDVSENVVLLLKICNRWVSIRASWRAHFFGRNTWISSRSANFWLWHSMAQE